MPSALARASSDTALAAVAPAAQASAATEPQASAATDPIGRAPEARPEARPEAAPATQPPAESRQLVPYQAPAEKSDEDFDTERALLQALLERRQGEKSEGQVMRKPAAAQKGAPACLRKPAASHNGAGPAKKKPAASHQGAGPAKKKPAAVQKGGLKEASSAGRAVNPSTERYSTMYYSATQKMAVRQKFGEKRQICQFGNGRAQREHLSTIAKAALAALERGSLREAGVRAFCEARL